MQSVLESQNSQDLVYRFFRQDGSQGWLWAKIEALVNGAGEMIGLHGVAMDVTEQKSVETALQDSESRFRKVFESAVVGMMFANINGQITEANDCLLKMLGYTRKELEAGLMRWDQITPPEYKSQDLEAIENLRIYGFTKPWEKEYYHKNGRRVPILMGASPLKGNQI
ncbi:PAS domain S-box protein [Synechocystis sp. B12]|nr:PAS domain S-box protein [Synechocystis sp. B12]